MAKLFKLIQEEGKHLSNSNKYPGAYNGTFLDDETNKVCGSAAFVEVDTNEHNTISLIAGVVIGVVITIVIEKVLPRIKAVFQNSVLPFFKNIIRKLFKHEKDDAEYSVVDPLPLSEEKTDPNSIIIKDEPTENIYDNINVQERLTAFASALTITQKIESQRAKSITSNI